MKNTFGTSVAVTLFGESHGEAVGVVIDGLAPGIRVCEEEIARRLGQRKPLPELSSVRREDDGFRIVSGVFNGRTTGTPVCILLPNRDVDSSAYEKTRGIARPGHADYAAYLKYHGFEDYRGGGHFSGRLTAPLVAAGAIALSALQKKNIRIGTHIARLGGVSDRPFGSFEDDLAMLDSARFAALDGDAAQRMKEEILSAANDGDSVGGVLESAVCGLPGGVGEPLFDTLEGTLAHALFAIPGVKGVQFGGGFDRCCERGSVFNDPLTLLDGKIASTKNDNGGVSGGISTGAPILIKTAVRPTPSIYREQQTADFLRGENTNLRLEGRHDPAIVYRARAVVDAMIALTLADALALRFGTDWLAEGEDQ